MMNMSKKTKNLLVYISPSIGIGVVLLIVYAMKGIYPFGTRGIAYYDMPQSMIPLYYHTWDVFHSVKSIYWDWNSGMGGSMADTMGNFIFNPFNLFFLFIKRNCVCDSMSIFLIIKLMVSAFSMSLYVKRTHPNIKNDVPVIMGGLYSACGYILQYYTNIHFLDIVAVFPLIVYSYELLVTKSKYLPYLLLMSYGFMTNLYLMYMVCVYLIYKVFLYIKTVDKEEKKSVTARMGIVTFSALGISSFSWIPMIMLLINSQRVGTSAASTGYIGTLFTSFCEMHGQKEFMLYGCEWVFALLIISIVITKRNMCDYRQHIYILILLILPIFIESINILWHLGGYAHFPMRFGYILTFESICLFTKIMEKNTLESLTTLGDNKISGYLSLTLTIITIIVIFSFVMSFTEFGIRDLNMYNGYWILVVLVASSVFFSVISRNDVIIRIVVYSIIISQICVGMYSFIGPQREMFSECSPELLYKAVSVADELEIESHANERYKNIDNSMITNYPFVTGLPAVSNWTWGTNAKLRETENALGYSSSYTRLLDNGGTIFSDAFLGMRHVITKGTINEKLYVKSSENQNEDFYNMIEYLPFVMYSSGKLDIVFTQEKFENNNKLFSALADDDTELIHIYNVNNLEYDIIRGKECVLKVRIPIETEGTVYVYSKNMTRGFAIIENGRIKMLPYQTQTENVIYPAPFQNGIIECGTYERDTELAFLIPTQFDKSDEDFLDDISIGVLDMEVLRREYKDIWKRQNLDVSFMKNSIIIEGNVKENGYLYIPVGYNSGWHTYVNGIKTAIESGVNGAVIMLPITAGNVNVNMRFSPIGWEIGIIISSLFVLFGLFVFFVERKRRIMLECERKIGIIAYPVIRIMGWGLITYMYLIPLLAWGYMQLIKLMNVT